ncbi:MAG: substrate-binding domain-containing protein [Xanthobacteraceae bacterium]
MNATNHIKILSGGAMRPLMARMIPLFERANAATIEIEFRLTSALKKAIEDGTVFDIAVLPRPELDELVKHGTIAPAGTADIARSTIGLAVRAGAPKPDIGSVSALRRSLVQACSIAYSDGPSGAYTAAVLEKLGIAEEMRPKTRLTSGPVAELVARDEADIGIQQIVAILPVEGAELVGPLPSELQNVIVYAAGLAKRPRNSALARAFIAFTATDEAKRLIRAAGLEPGRG